jgi:hypothetical protein
MREEHGETEDSAEVQAPQEDYVAPALTDLGSFHELTQLGSTGVVDVEGQS